MNARYLDLVSHVLVFAIAKLAVPAAPVWRRGLGL